MPITRQAAGEAIIAALQELVSIALPSDAAVAIAQLNQGEVTARLRFAAIAMSGEIEGAPGCSIAFSETGICAVVTPAGRFVFDLKAGANHAAREMAFTTLAGHATKYFPTTRPPHPPLTIIP